MTARIVDQCLPQPSSEKHPTGSEHVPRMELYEENSDCEKTRQEHCDHSLFKHIVLWMCFCALPGVSDKSQFASEYLLQLAVVICLNAFMEKYVFAMCYLSLWLYTAWTKEYFPCLSIQKSERSPMLGKNVRTGTQEGQEPGSRAWFTGYGRYYLLAS